MSVLAPMSTISRKIWFQSVVFRDVQ